MHTSGSNSCLFVSIPEPASYRIGVFRLAGFVEAVIQAVNVRDGDQFVVFYFVKWHSGYPVTDQPFNKAVLVLRLRNESVFVAVDVAGRLRVTLTLAEIAVTVAL